MKKKLLLLLTIGVVLALGLCACGKDKEKDDTKIELKEKDSSGNLTEYGVVKELKARGFENVEVIYTEKDKDGNAKSVQVDEKSNKSHMAYIAVFYDDKTNYMWSIEIVKDRFKAVPVYFQTVNKIEQTLMVVDKDKVLYYDAGTETCFEKEIEKDNEALNIVKIDKITADAIRNFDYDLFGVEYEPPAVLDKEQLITGADAKAKLKELGFEGEVGVNYDSYGRVGMKVELDENEKYPEYILNYKTQDGHEWIIHLIGNKIKARLVHDRFETGGNWLYISETDTIADYDVHTRSVIDAEPNLEEIHFEKVEKINAEALENFDYTILDKYRK